MNELARRNRSVSILLLSALVVPLCVAFSDPAAAAAPASVSSPQITTNQVDKTATLDWTAPTVNVDGTPIAEALTYNVYAGLCSLTDLPKVLGPLTGLNAVLTNQGAGERCYQLTAVSASGGESVRTERASKTFHSPAPNTAPTLTVK